MSARAAHPLSVVRSAAPRAAILLDFDGTLSPIAERPDLARLQPGMHRVLVELVREFELVAVVSGRTRDEVATLVRVDGVLIEGSYGLTLSGGSDPIPREIVRRVEEVAAVLPGSFVEPKGVTIALHVRGTDDPDSAEASARRLLAPIADGAGLRLVGGKRVVELVPSSASLKADAVRRLLAAPEIHAALFAGDDEGDLGAFAELDRTPVEGVKVAVRGSETPRAVIEAADVVVDGPAGLLKLLRSLLG